MNAQPVWLNTWREEARITVQQLGLPSRKLEAWHYTSLPAWDVNSLKAKPGHGDAAFATVKLRSVITINFVDGIAQDFTCPPLPSGVIIAPLSQQLRDNADEARYAFGTSTQGKQRSLVAINMAEFQDGLLIHIPQGVKLAQPIVMQTHGRADSVSHLRVLVNLEENASATLVQLHTAGENAITTIVNEFKLATGARLDHYRAQYEDHTATQLMFTDIDVAEHATFDHFSLTTGAKLSRHEIVTRLTGEYATCHVNGSSVLTAAQHTDFTSIIDHMQPHGQSRQTVKHVLSDKSRAVFQGRIHVHQPAQKTDGYQMNQTLLLSDGAEINAKPELEIYADDVKCSHGATVGQLDDDALFYLRSRGIDEQTAKQLLVRAFVQQALDLIDNTGVREMFENYLTRGS